MEKKYYLVTYNGNYADEFDVYFHTVMSESELNYVKEFLSKSNWEWKIVSFGTNEELEVLRKELLEFLDDAREITQEEFEVLERLGLAKISFGDGLNWDWILEYE